MPKLPIISKIVPVKVIENLISPKKISGRTCLSPPGVKIDIFQILYCTEIGKLIHFWAERCQNNGLYQKVAKIKVVRI